MEAARTSRKAAYLHRLLQVAALAAFWQVGELIVRFTHLAIPGSIAGMFLLLALLLTGKISVRSFSSGADLLLREMLLFFIPAVVVVLNHREFFGWIGLKLLAAILLGTVVVMTTTAFIVDLYWRLARRSEQLS